MSSGEGFSLQFHFSGVPKAPTVWPGQRQLLEALELTVHVWPNRLELKGWGSVTLTGELAMGDVDIQIDGLEPQGDEEPYLPEESRNSSATRLNVSGCSK